MPTRRTIARRVARGIAWLTEQDPHWHRAIDLDRLDLSDAWACPLGQVYGFYGAGSQRLCASLGRSWVDEPANGRTYPPQTHGFYLHRVNGDAYAPLQARWTREIHALQEGDEAAERVEP